MATYAKYIIVFKNMSIFIIAPNALKHVPNSLGPIVHGRDDVLFTKVLLVWMRIRS